VTNNLAAQEYISAGSQADSQAILVPGARLTNSRNPARELQDVKARCAWGIAGGTLLVERRDDVCTQELTPDFESGPRSHPETSEDFRRGPPTSSALARTSRIQADPSSANFQGLPPRARAWWGYFWGLLWRYLWLFYWRLFSLSSKQAYRFRR